MTPKSTKSDGEQNRRGTDKKIEMYFVFLEWFSYRRKLKSSLGGPQIILVRNRMIASKWLVHGWINLLSYARTAHLHHIYQHRVAVVVINFVSSNRQTHSLTCSSIEMHADDVFSSDFLYFNVQTYLSFRVGTLW